MIKHLIKILKTNFSKKNLSFLKVEIIEKYELLHEKIKNQDYQSWEEDFFKEILINLQTSKATKAPYDILNAYMSKYFEEIEYDSLLVSNSFLYENRYHIVFLTEKEYGKLTKAIFNQQAKIIDIVSERARTLILKSTEDFIISATIYNSDYHKGEA